MDASISVRLSATVCAIEARAIRYAAAMAAGGEQTLAIAAELARRAAADDNRIGRP